MACALVFASVAVWAWVLYSQSAATAELTPRAAPVAQPFLDAPGEWLAHPVPVSDFESAIAAGKVREVAVNGLRAFYTTTDGKKFSTVMLPSRDGLASRLERLSDEKNFTVVAADIDARNSSERFKDQWKDFVDGASKAAYFAMLGAVVFLVAFQLKGGALFGGGAKLVKKPTTQFSDVIGAEEAKRQLRRVQAFFQNPERYVSIGGQPPHGVLMEGPPGVGKTLMAQALAGECGAKFIAVDGSYFSSMFYGQGIAKVKALFELARKNAPCILFIDEFDGIGKRSSGPAQGPGAGEENRIINQILVQMDGFSKLEGVCVIGATNHRDNIDTGILRPGRFDSLVTVGMPSLPERKEIFELYLRKVKAAAGIDCLALAKSTGEMSPAQIRNIVNKAASRAAEDGSSEVSQDHLHDSIEAVQMGGEVTASRGLVTEEVRRRVARHESGHALVAHVVGNGNVGRVSIEPRGRALGVTFTSRESEDPLYGEDELRAELAKLLGGREAELMAYGNTSSGAADDLKRASQLAASMVGNLGFSKEFGLLSMEGLPKEFIGPDIQRQLIAEAKVMLNEAQLTCVKVLTQYATHMDALTQALLDEETIGGARLQSLLPPRNTANLLLAA